MKLWHLLPVENLPKHDDPWDPRHDKCFGMIVRAEDEESARIVAQDNSGAEKRDYSTVWLQSKYSTCTELMQDGDTEIIIADTLWS